MCLDDKSFFERDKQKLAPLLEKWGIEATKEKEELEKTQKTEIAVTSNNRPRIG